MDPLGFRPAWGMGRGVGRGRVGGGPGSWAGLGSARFAGLGGGVGGGQVYIPTAKKGSVHSHPPSHIIGSNWG